jgi:hypothetical protein
MRPAQFTTTLFLGLAALCAAGLADAQAQGPAPVKGGSDTAAAAPAPGLRTFRLTNGGKTGITAVYAAPTGSNNLSDDLLGKQTAGVGRTVTLKVNDATGTCVYDLQLLMSNGDTADVKSLDLCKTAAVNYPH